MTSLKSAHELRSKLRTARIQLGIQEKQLAALRACLRGEHQLPTKQTTECFVCGITSNV